MPACADKATSDGVEGHPYREFERAGWERAADAYADSFAAITGLFVRPLLEAVGAGPGVRILDVACATGPVASMAAGCGSSVEGLDFSPNMVAAARRRHPALSFRQGDAEALPFADGSFDAVVIGFGVHHFPFPVRALGDARRVLRVGGRLGFTVWASPEEHLLTKLVVDAVRETGNAAPALPTPPGGPINARESCMRLLCEAGFDAAAIRVERLAARASIDSATALIDLLGAGTVRLSSVIRSLPRDKASLLVAALDRSMQSYRDGVGFRIPAVALLALGIKTG